MKVLGHGSLSSAVLTLIKVSWYGVAAILAITIVLVVASPFIDFSGGEVSVPASFTVDTRALPVVAPSLGIAAVGLRKVRGELVFPPPSRSSLVAPAAALVVGLLFMLWVLSQLSAVFQSLRDGHPFVPQNAMRIRWIGYAVMLGEVARAVVTFATTRFVAGHFSAPGLRFDAMPDLSVMTLVHGLIILVIAEVFRAGTRLDEDQSLTI